MRRERLSRIALALLGFALCALLFYGALELGSDRSRGDGRGGERKIVGLGSIPSPRLLHLTDTGLESLRSEEASKGKEEAGEGAGSEIEAGEGAVTPGEGEEEAVPTSGGGPESTDTSGSGGESKEAAPKEDPPIEITPGR